MSDPGLMLRSAIELAGMVRSGQISSRELVETALERIEELNPSLNAFVDVDAERALAAAEAVSPGDERPFAGVPTAIKNNRPVQGLRLTYGCSLMEQSMCDYDHNITRRLKEAGFVIVGTTTLPEYGILPTTEARIFGPTRNPWDLARTPGDPPVAPLPQWPAECFLSLTATTAGGPCGSPLPAVAWWA